MIRTPRKASFSRADSVLPMDHFPLPLPRPPYRAAAFVEALDNDEDDDQPEESSSPPDSTANPGVRRAVGDSMEITSDGEGEDGSNTDSDDDAAASGDLKRESVSDMMSVEDQLRQLIAESHALQVQSAIFRNEVEVLHCRAFVVTVENEMVRRMSSV